MQQLIEIATAALERLPAALRGKHHEAIQLAAESDRVGDPRGLTRYRDQADAYLVAASIAEEQLRLLHRALSQAATAQAQAQQPTAEPEPWEMDEHAQVDHANAYETWVDTERAAEEDDLPGWAIEQATQQAPAGATWADILTLARQLMAIPADGDPLGFTPTRHTPPAELRDRRPETTAQAQAREVA